MGEEQFIKAYVHSLTKVGSDGLLITKKYLTHPDKGNAVFQFHVDGRGQGEEIITKEEARQDWEMSIKQGYTPVLNADHTLKVEYAYHAYFNPSMLASSPYAKNTWSYRAENLHILKDRYENEDTDDFTSYALRA